MMKKKLTYLLFISIAAITSCGKDEPIPPPPVLRLDYVEVKEMQGGATFYLYGEFPNQNSSAKIYYDGGDGYIIKRWSNVFIEVFISEIITNKFGGEIAVGLDGYHSNKRKITVWKGLLTYTYPNPGTLVEKVNFEVILRADIDAHRNTTQPLLHPLTSFVSSAKATYTIGGHGESIYKDDGAACFTRQTVDWGQASGELNWRSQDSSVIKNENTYNAIIEFQEGVGFKIKDLNVWKTKASTTQTRFYPVSPCTGPGSTGPLFDFELVDIPDQIFKTPVNNFYDVFMELGGTSIKQGKKIIRLQNFAGLMYNPPVPEHDVTLQWDAMQKIN